MLESYLRPIFQTCIVDPIAAWTRNFPPSFITCLAALTGIMVAPLLVLHMPALATLMLLMSGFLDTLDGTIARMENKVSDAGNIFDIVSDRVVELAVIVGLFAVDPLHRAWMSLGILGSCYLCITCFLVIAIFLPNRSEKGFHYNTGLMERAEAFVFFMLMIWLPSHFHFLGLMFISLMLLTSYLHVKTFLRLKNH